jgi:hypothetical protein
VNTASPLSSASDSQVISHPNPHPSLPRSASRARRGGEGPGPDSTLRYDSADTCRPPCSLLTLGGHSPGAVGHRSPALRSGHFAWPVTFPEVRGALIVILSCAVQRRSRISSKGSGA